MPNKLRSEFIRRNLIKENWHKLYKYKDCISWNNISSNYDLSEEFIYEFQNYLNWISLSYHQNLSENLIRDFQDQVNWKLISKYQILSDEFIIEFSDYVVWEYILKYKILQENTIRKYVHYFNEYEISKLWKHQILSEDFIRDFEPITSQPVYWTMVSKSQKLSEKFIREFQDKLYWFYIAKYQVLSEDFIIEFKHRFLDTICLNNHIKYFSTRLVKLFAPYLNDYYIYNYAANKIREIWLKKYYKPGNRGYINTVTKFEQEFKQNFLS